VQPLRSQTVELSQGSFAKPIHRWHRAIVEFLIDPPRRMVMQFSCLTPQTASFQALESLFNSRLRRDVKIADTFFRLVLGLKPSLNR